MKFQEVKSDLLAIIGVEDVSFLDTPTNERMLRDVNATLQKLWTMVPQWWTTPIQDALLQAPQAVTLTVTQGSKTFSGFTPSAWMIGCTIKIADDTFNNEITSATTLARPFLGTTGSKSATVYCDAVALPSDTLAVFPPVMVLGLGELQSARTKRDLLALNNGTAAPPTTYFLERRSDASNIATHMLRVAPFPDILYALAFDAKRNVPQVTLAAWNDAANTGTVPIPEEYIESIFLPFVRGAFATWKHVTEEVRSGLLADRETATAMLPAIVGRNSNSTALTTLPLTSAGVRDDLLGLIGIGDASEATGITLRRIVADINGTIAEMKGMHPHIFSAATKISTLGTGAISIPTDYQESVFLPLVRARFATWPGFTGDGASLQASREQALIALEDLIRRSETGATTADGTWNSAKIRDDLLSLAGISNPTGAPKAVLNRILADVNGALQDIYQQAPHYFGTAFSAVTTLGTSSLPIAAEFIDPVVVPLIRARFATFNPAIGDSTRDTLLAQREPAMAMLGEMIRNSADKTLSATPLTTAGVRDDLLGMMGIGDAAAANGPTLRRIVADINNTLAEIYSHHPHYFTPFAAVSTLDNTALPLSIELLSGVFLPMIRARFASWEGFAGDKANRHDWKLAYDSAVETLARLVNNTQTGRTLAPTFNAQGVALDLLGLIGVNTMLAADVVTQQRIMADINATLQKLWSMVPQWWTTYTDGEVLRAPVQIGGITATNGSRTISASPAIEAWMHGCTIRIDGDPYDNELATASTLARPYAGATGSGKTAMVYGDCVTLGATVSGVIPPVILMGERELVGVGNKRDLRQFSSGSTQYEGNISQVVSDRKDIGTPSAFHVENNRTMAGQTHRLRVSPLPDKAYVLQFESRQITPRIAALDTTAIPVPDQYIESIFLPMLRKQFSTWPKYKITGLRELIDEQYQDAFQMLTKLKPQPVRAGFVRVREGW
jgi:hypothetical protein